MHEEKYGKAALQVMYAQGKGILSPIKFSEKRMSYQWAGFGIGVLGAMICLKLFDIDLEGSFLYLALGLSALIGGLGVIAMTNIFDANFVCDDSLKDSLLPPRR